MKKICFVKMDMTDASGGARVAANVANALSDKYEVHVVSICSNEDTTFYKLDDKVKYKVLVKGTGRIREVLFKGIKELRRYLKDNKIDIAFSVGVSINPFLVPATKGIKCKAVSCEHVNCLNEYQNTKGQRLCRYLGAKLAGKVIVLTKQDRDAYIKKYHLNKKKVVYIHNWMDEALFEGENIYNSSSKRIVSVVRLEPVKGVESIIEVAKELKGDYPDWCFDIYGGGEEDYVSKLKGKIEEYNLSGYVNLLGKVNDIYDRYKDYGIYLMTSHAEGLPMVLLEAKAKRIPCISFDCLTGPREIIRDGEDGYLVPMGDIQYLKKRLSQCMSDKVLREKLSEASYGNLSLFKKEAILERWVKFIERI